MGTEHFYIKPTPNYYDPFNSAIHGIKDTHTRTQKTFKEQWKDLKKYFHNQTVVAHNAAFDCSVLRFTLDNAMLAYPDLDYHCTYRLAQVTLPITGHRLNEVSSHFKIKLNHHDAESDAKASALIALKLCEKYKANSLQELSTSLGFKVGKIVSKTKSYCPFSKR
jgi:DNA polymerase-3 subunit epsilon